MLFVVVSAGCSSRVVPPATPSDGDSTSAGDAAGDNGDTALIRAPLKPTTTRLRYPTTQTQSPITPGVATNLIAIAAIDATRHDDMFMKVGDSISESYAVMSCFADPTMVTLASYDGLEPIIDFYRAANVSGPTDCTEVWCANAHTAYNRASYAAVGGTTADTPLHVSAGASKTSLELEDEAIHPRVALVEFGTNDSTIIDQPQKLDDFYGNMQLLVTAITKRGIIPVLYTIPPYVSDRAGYLNVPTINAIIRVIAQGNSIPLIDFYRESLPLPNWGLWDGTHPTQADGGACRFDATSLQAGFNVRNLISMIALDRVHAILGGSDAPDALAEVSGTGDAASPFVIGELPFVDSGTAAGVTYSMSVSAPTRLRAIAFGSNAAVAIANIASPAHLVQQQLAAGDYTITVSGDGAYDLVLVACDPNDTVCN
jgi:hypothetical protein